jgi:hypothetical protein
MLVELWVRGLPERPSREGTIERARDWLCRFAGAGANGKRRAASGCWLWSCTMFVCWPIYRSVCRSGLPPFGMQSTLLKLVTGVCGRSGQSHPYVRPAARPLPLAIMDVRRRVRRQSVWRARGTRLSTASPETAWLAVLSITLFSACCRVERACARCLPCARTRHAIAVAAGAAPPFAR